MQLFIILHYDYNIIMQPKQLVLNIIVIALKKLYMKEVMEVEKGNFA